MIISPKNVPDPGSEIRKKFIPDPDQRGKKAPDSESATLVTHNKILLNS
jgi:hypothetical protein